MPPKKSKAKPRRVRRRKNNPAKTLRMKPYSYVFSLESQVLHNTITGSPPLMEFSATAGNSPLLNSATSIQPSTNGLTNYYDIGLSCPFALLDILSAPQFTALYDAYKLGKITCTVEYLSNVSAVNGSGLMPTLYTYWDQDDFVTPSSVSQVQAKQGHKRTQFGNKMRTSISTTGSPEPITRAGSIPSLLNTNKEQWVNCTDPGLLHYALKMYITDVYLPGGTTVAQAFRFNFKYNVQFRSPIDTT